MAGGKGDRMMVKSTRRRVHDAGRWCNWVSRQRGRRRGPSGAGLGAAIPTKSRDTHRLASAEIELGVREPGDAHAHACTHARPTARSRPWPSRQGGEEGGGHRPSSRSRTHTHARWGADCQQLEAGPRPLLRASPSLSEATSCVSLAASQSVVCVCVFQFCNFHRSSRASFQVPL
jgi:hypothetical protein